MVKTKLWAYASQVKTGEYMRQSLDQGLTLFRSLCTRSPRLYAYWLRAEIWKRSLQPFRQ